MAKKEAGLLKRTFKGSSLEGYVEAAKVKTLDKFRKLPKKMQILAKAEEKAMLGQWAAMKTDPITPTEKELKETGMYREAQHDLMRGETTKWNLEQRKYIDDMAAEMGLKVVTQKEYRQLSKLMAEPENHKRMKNGDKPTPQLKRQVRKLLKPKRERPLKIPTPSMPKISSVPQKKKRKKNHSQRVGKIPRVLRKRINDGQKTFSFPANVWKVRSPRRKRRKRR